MSPEHGPTQDPLPSSEENHGHPPPPLVVDLDGSLTPADTAWESFLSLLLSRPWQLFQVFRATLQGGRAGAKARLSELAPIDPATLPWRQDLLAALKEEKKQGRTLILATGAYQTTAQRVAEHLQLFDQVLSSDAQVNLTGRNKADALVEQFGTFDYVGDSRADLQVWPHARQAWVCGPPQLFRKQLDPTKVTRRFTPANTTTASTVRALRPHQWAKNALLFVPMLTAHQVSDLALWSSMLMAFVALSFTASVGYLFNDLLDRQADRQHTKKHRRPIAAGDLLIPEALTLATVCGAIASIITILIGSPLFALFLAAYFGLSVSYSIWLKKRMLLDVFVLAWLYYARIVLGGAVSGYWPSPWLSTFAIFFFISLAFLKRFSEIQNLTRASAMETPIARRGYFSCDLEMVRTLGAGSGLMAIVIFGLYLYSPVVTELYQHPVFLMAVWQILFFWIARLWMLAGRDQVHHDPVLFALRDPASYLMAGLILLAGLMAKGL